MAYTGSFVSNVVGGQERGSVFQNAAVAQATFDLKRSFGWKGADAFLSVLGTSGLDPSVLVGDVQGVLNGAAPLGIRVEEVWIQENVFGNRVSLLLGRYDINSEFYRLQSSAIFLNSSFGIGPELATSGVEGPSTYPFTSVGGRVAYKPSPNSVLRAAVLDGVPVDRPNGGIHLFAPGDGIFAIGEIALLSREDTTARMYNRRFLIGRGPSRPYESKLVIGGWAYTTDFPDLSDTLASGAPAIRHGSSGAYLIGDWVAWSAGPERPTMVALFAQLGLGDPTVDVVGGYVGAGLALTGLFHRRPSDQIGFAVASAQMGSHFRRAQNATGTPAARTETTLNLTYVANIASWAEVHPDVQYVIHPGGTLVVRKALVPGIQVAVSKTF